VCIRPFISVSSSVGGDQKASLFVTPFMWFFPYTYSVSTGFFVSSCLENMACPGIGFHGFIHHMKFQRWACHCACNIAATDGLLQTIGNSDLPLCTRFVALAS